MTHVLVVGKKFSALTDYLVAHKYTYTVLQDRQATKFPDKRFKHRVVADFSSLESLFATVDTLQTTPNLVLATYENYILPAAHIAAHLGLPGIPATAAEACTDKFLMRSLFAQAPEKISPDFAIVRTEDDLRAFAANHTFPLILKPANLAKSLLVTKSNSLDELLANYHIATRLLNSTYAKYAPNRTPSLIVEEFLAGSVHSVDAFVDGTGTPHILDAVVDYQTGYDIGYDDNFHYSRLLPSALSTKDQTALRRCADIGIRALGMKHTPAHVEIIMTADGPRIVEIGARNGGYRERMHRLANGIDITGAALQTAAGGIPTVASSYRYSCAVLELFPHSEGSFVGITHLEELQQLPSLNYLSIKTQPGDTVGKASGGHKAVAVIILSHENHAQFAADKHFVDTHCAIQTEG